MLCLGIIWNSVQEYKNLIVADIQEYGDVLAIFDLTLDNLYGDFVRDVYSQEEIAKWKIDKKIETMIDSSDDRSVTIVFLELDITEQYYHEHKKKMVYANLDRLKKHIREKYSQLVSNYFFDNVFHLTDDEREFKACLKILENYSIKIPSHTIDIGNTKTSSTNKVKKISP